MIGITDLIKDNAKRVAALLRRIRSRRAIIYMAIGLSLMLLAGCGSKPFNVKTDVTFPISADAPLAEANGIRMQAAVIRDEDALLATFDANLIVADVLPVNVTITNQTSQPIDLRKAGFAVRAVDGKAYKAAEINRAFKRLISFYQISTYSKPAFKKSREDFASYALDTTRPLAIGESRHGMVFFIVPDQVVQATGLKLVGVRLDATQPKNSIELSLN